MKNYQKHLSVCSIALATLLSVPFQGAWAATAPVLGGAAAFSVLGGTAVTCTNGSITGDVGVAPGNAYTNTGCAITGGVPPATNAAAVVARANFLTAYAALQQQSASCIQVPGDLANRNLAPGVYCTDGVAKTGALTLTGPADGVWIFLVNGALTGTNFSVDMAGGGLSGNVFWAPTTAATMTNSAFTGDILAGDSAGGSVTFTGGTLSGKALANIAVTITGTHVTDAVTPVAATPVAGSTSHHPSYLSNPFGS